MRKTVTIVSISARYGKETDNAYGQTPPAYNASRGAHFMPCLRRIRARGNHRNIGAWSASRKPGDSSGANLQLRLRAHRTASDQLAGAGRWRSAYNYDSSEW